MPSSSSDCVSTSKSSPYNLLCIIKLGLCKQKTLQLQFVSRQVVLQHRSLFSASPHLFDDFFRQLNVLRYHLLLVLQFVEVEVETSQQETFAIFSHGGSGACVLAHLLALPFPYVCTVLPYEFTSIIILEFPVRPGEYIHPRIELFNDAAHILELSKGLVFQQTAD